MISSKNEFFIGCVIGGILGAATALFVPKKFLNGCIQVNKHHLHAKAHGNNHTRAHSSKSHAPKKTASRKIVKRKRTA